MLYEPREDSFLLQRHVKKYSFGLVLDIGTGSGIQALEAAKKKKVKKVIAVDIQKEVIENCKKNIKNKKITFKTSNLFSKINKKFDTIIFNPPYLPEDIKLKDLTIDGGKKGYEILEKFLNNVNNYIKDNGIILIVFSSLTKKHKIDETIRNKLLEFKLLEKKPIFFEDLYAYLIKKSNLLKKLEKRKVKNLGYLTKGHRGILFTGKYKNKKIVIKAKNPESKAKGRIKNEIKYLKILNKHNIGPKLLFHEKDFFAYEYVKGIFIIPYLKKSNKTTIKKTLKNIFRQLHALDKLKVDKEEMHHPFKHIVIGKKIVLLDFERCHLTKKQKNITQFLTCLIRKDMDNLLKDKGIILNRNQVIETAKKYKKTYDFNILKKVL